MNSRRFSKQREQIYQLVSGSAAHPTAQDVYDALKPQLPRLSLGTVYRNLHQMALEGRLQEMEGPPARFEANVAPHTHFRCISCGGVSDLRDISYDIALDEAAQRGGRVVLNHNLMFTGYCSACAENRKIIQF